MGGPSRMECPEMTDQFDPYHSWLAIPKQEQPPDHYRLLGVPRYEENADVLSNASDQRCHFLRTLQTGRHAANSQRLLNEVAAAAGCLLNPDRKAAYDGQLRAQEARRIPAPAPAGRARPNSALIAGAVAVPIVLALVVVAVLAMGGNPPIEEAAVPPPAPNP